MSLKVAINGFGRIGRCVLRRALSTGKVEVVAINDVFDSKMYPMMAHLFKYDSVFRTWPEDVKVEGDALVIGGKKIKILSEKDPTKLPWKDLGADVVIESTGKFLSPAKANLHIKGGTKKVILTAPSKSSPPDELEKLGYGKADVDGTFVLGVNDQLYDPKNHHIISNASCTTNCLAPVAKVLNDHFKIKSGFMTTIHAYTNDQRLVDLPHDDIRRARAAAVSMIPTKTGAAKAIGLVIPELEGKLDGIAIRVPTPDVSIVDLTVAVEKDTTKEEVNAAIKAAADGPMKGILLYQTDQCVSVDFTGNDASSIFDVALTKVIDKKMVKIFSWYDNEWGYSCRVVDLAVLLGSKL
jgi:glyceraldehyde 3-phosphate dehydrogenase